MKFITLLISCSVSANEVTTINLAFEDRDSFPNYLGNSSHVAWPNPGYAVELLKQLEKSLPIKIKFVRQPWKRCLKSLQTNSVDGIFNASFKQERLALGVYPFTDGKVDPEFRIAESSHVFFSKKGSPIHWDGKQLDNFNGQVGVVMGYSTAADLQQRGIDVRESINSPQQNLDLLLHNRVPIIAGSEVQYQNIMRRNPGKYAAVVAMRPAITTKPYYLMLAYDFHAAHPKLSQKIWAEIKSIRVSEEGQRLRRKYYIAEQ